MSNTAKLKKKAAEFESRKQYEKALELYEQVLNGARASDEERDVPLYNRVGDIHYRIGNNEKAITYYEQAADLYAEGGFFNNAIALCNKILRYSPGRTIVYYKLGIISAKKGFNSDAKQNFLEYADRMQRIGKMDEAFRALKEFADLCPGQDDVRLMLAEQLTRADRKQEALEQLEILYDTLEAEGRTGEAAATIERMKTLDPAFKPTRSLAARPRKKEGLVFLDLDFDTPPAPSPAKELPDDVPEKSESTKPAADQDGATVGANRVATSESPPPAAAPEGLQLTALDEEPRPPATSELRFITTPAEQSPDESLPDIAPIDLAPLVDAPAEAETEADTPPHYTDEQTAEHERSADANEAQRADANDGEEGAAETDNDPRVIPFPIGRTPAGASPALETPVGFDPLAGLDVIVPADAGDDSETMDDSPPESDSDFIDLGEWLERNRTPSSTRMVAHDEAPENNEQKDFAEMLDKFKSGIARNVEAEDFESHYDLGIAFAEMGLLDEAISSFQKAQRGPDQRVRASEAIGQCFMDKGEASLAVAVLGKLLHEPGMSDSRMVGVLYLLGRAAESLGRSAEAAGYYHRVLAVQIGFRDAADRLAALSTAAK